MTRRRRAPGTGVWLALALAACDAPLLHGLDEPEANDVLHALAGAGIEARKVSEAGGRFRVDVPREALPDAWEHARAAGHPREGEEPEPDRLVVGPTEAAAHARARSARAMARLLRDTPGVHDAEVVQSASGVAAVLRVTPEGPTDLEARARRLLANGTGLPEAQIAIEVAPARASTPARGLAASAPAPPSGLLVVAGAGIVALAALCALLLWRTRRLRRGSIA